MVGDIIKVNDWKTKTKNKLDFDIQQDYKECVSEMIKVNNADLLQQMITNNENKELLLSQKINKQKKCKYEQLAEKIHKFRFFLRNYNNSKYDNKDAKIKSVLNKGNQTKDDEIKADFKRRKSKCLIKLRKKNKKPHQFNLNGKTKAK